MVDVALKPQGQRRPVTARHADIAAIEPHRVAGPLAVVKLRPLRRVIEGLGKRAQMKGRARQRLVGAEQQRRVILPLRRAQEVFADLPRRLKHALVFVDLIQAIEDRKERGGIIEPLA